MYQSQQQKIYLTINVKERGRNRKGKDEKERGWKNEEEGGGRDGDIKKTDTTLGSHSIPSVVPHPGLLSDDRSQWLL